jgi:hypothetical protein
MSDSLTTMQDPRRSAKAPSKAASSALLLLLVACAGESGSAGETGATAGAGGAGGTMSAGPGGGCWDATDSQRHVAPAPAAGGSEDAGSAGSGGVSGSAGVAGSGGADEVDGGAGAGGLGPGIGSKCMTKCPQNLTCVGNEIEWKGLCTRECSVDADCQGTGVTGVCASGRCYQSCTPGVAECRRLRFTCQGEAGRTYCSSVVAGGGNAGTAGSGAGGSVAGRCSSP